MVKQMKFNVLLAGVATLVLFGWASLSAGSKSAKKPSKADVEAAQIEWGEGIVAISSVHTKGGDYKARAKEHIKTLYAYGETDVMFKPTLAAKDQFRETFDEALAYFIGKSGNGRLGFRNQGMDESPLGEQRYLHRRRLCHGHG